MKKKNLLFLLLLFPIVIMSQPGGNLFVIGGGSIPKYLIEKYVELAGGKDSGFLVVPMASSIPDESGNSFAKRLLEAGCSKIKVLIGNRVTVDHDSNLSKLKNINAVFLTGGDQSRLVKALAGTRMLDLIKSIYKKGGVIGGTSAGAAVMSKLMITGKELVNKDTVNAFNIISKGNIETAEGFGLIENAIVDQHFIKRKRMNRLISLVLENPELLGIGIDESTAVIIRHDNSFKVLGENLVMVFDASESKSIALDKNNNQSAYGMKIHLLKSGDEFYFNKETKPNKVKQ